MGMSIALAFMDSTFRNCIPRKVTKGNYLLIVKKELEGIAVYILPNYDNHHLFQHTQPLDPRLSL
jgi:hypothetical protein